MDSKLKKVELIGKIIEDAPIKNKEFVKKIKVVANKFYDDDVSIEFSFHHDVLDTTQREEFMNDVWSLIFNYLDTPVFLVQVDEKGKMNENDDKEIKLLTEFMENLDVEGICGFFIDPEHDEHDFIWVYIILDLDWLNDNQHPTKPGFVANRMRNGVKEEIKKYLGLDVRVGSVAKKCDDVD